MPDEDILDDEDLTPKPRLGPDGEPIDLEDEEEEDEDAGEFSNADAE